MEMTDRPKRKPTRLQNFDYSAGGAYFVTICTKDRLRILSDIIPPVGVGALDDPKIKLTKIGRIIENHLLSSEKIPGVKIDRYVIMPDHIHAIIILYPDRYAFKGVGSSKAPTPTNAMLPHVISAFKRLCSKEIGSNVFQRGYAEHIIRDGEDYETRRNYIYENPKRWFYR